MPTPGPVAYQVHLSSFTSAVMSRGFDQVTPSSVLDVTHTVHVPLDVPARIAFSESEPRLWVCSRKMAPLCRSTTAHGLPAAALNGMASRAAQNPVRSTSISHLLS